MKNLFYLIIVAGVIFFSIASTSALVAADYDHKISLDRISFEWKLNGKTIHIQLKAKTKGWVAVGFNPKSGMKGANFIIGYVKRGKVEIRDEFGVRRTEHIQDTKNNGRNDIKDISGSEKAGYTTISFTIPLNSGDRSDSLLNPNFPVKVLLAFGPKKDSFSARHIYRTALTVDLKTGQQI